MPKGVLIKQGTGNIELSEDENRELWADFGETLLASARQVKKSDFEPNGIAMVMRGGAYLGVYLSHFFKQNCVAILLARSYKNGKPLGEDAEYSRNWVCSDYEMSGDVILVDDLADSGVTLSKALDSLLEQYPRIKRVLIVTLYYKKQSIVIPDKHLGLVFGWIVFPYEGDIIVREALTPPIGHGGSESWLTQE